MATQALSLPSSVHNRVGRYTQLSSGEKSIPIVRHVISETEVTGSSTVIFFLVCILVLFDYFCLIVILIFLLHNFSI